MTKEEILKLQMESGHKPGTWEWDHIQNNPGSYTSSVNSFSGTTNADNTVGGLSALSGLSNVDPDPLGGLTQWSNDPKTGELVKRTPDGMAATVDQYGNPLGSDKGWGAKEWGTAGNLALGAGQLGLGLASYFENKKTANAQRKLLGQQYDSNKEFIADRRANKAALSQLVIN